MKGFGYLLIVSAIGCFIFSIILLILKLDFVGGSVFGTFCVFFGSAIIDFAIGCCFVNDANRLDEMERRLDRICNEINPKQTKSNGQPVSNTYVQKTPLPKKSKICKHCGGQLDVTGFCNDCGTQN